MGESTKHLFDAIKTIVEKHPERNQNNFEGAKGIIKCPKCGEDLHYTVAGCNGHIWGKCKTENCLQWMM